MRSKVSTRDKNQFHLKVLEHKNIFNPLIFTCKISKYQF